MKIPWLESEFFYILTLYGILGVFLNYTFVLLIGAYGLKYYKEYGGNFIFIPIILLAYIIFSFGGYFMREYYSGLPFWIISGILLGSVNTTGHHRDLNLYNNKWRMLNDGITFKD